MIILYATYYDEIGRYICLGIHGVPKKIFYSLFGFESENLQSWVLPKNFEL
jgi:hypothetical protein